MATLRPSFAEGPAQSEPHREPALTKRWLVLWDARKQRGGRAALPDNSSLQNLTDLKITGVPNADPFWLHDFQVDGLWGSLNRRLQPVSGKDTAVKLARAEDFELQAVMNAEGRGGWFILLGLKEGHGYVFYNVTLRLSGSPWISAELRDSTIVEETHDEIHRHVWKGDQPLFLTVKDKKLTLKVGRETIAKDFEMPNYHAGHVVLGTYDTPYGPKPVSIRSLRIRAK